MNRKLVNVLAGVMMAAAAMAQQAEVGKAAPDFSLPGIDGRTNTLSALKGKFVVLEWTNLDCPFVKKHYDAGNMQKLQKEWMGKEVCWLVVNSSAPGKQGNYPAEKWAELMKQKNAAPTAVLLDPDGKVGKLYGAKTTPHMFVIDKAGTLIYAGAIDDKPSFDPKTLEGAVNYVSQALESAMAGKPVEKPATPSYGCSVKY